jgi:hypothetical protein
MNQSVKLTIANLGGGGLIEDFDRELRAVCENIADPNVKTDAVRTVTVIVKVKPDKKGQTAGVSFSVKSSLPGAEPGEQMAWIAMGDDKELGLFQVDTRQNPLPFVEPTVTEIHAVSPPAQPAKVAEMPAPTFAPPMGNN